MMFCSFFFITGVVFVVLDSRESLQEEIHQKVAEEISVGDENLRSKEGIQQDVENVDMPPESQEYIIQEEQISVPEVVSSVQIIQEPVENENIRSLPEEDVQAPSLEKEKGSGMSGVNKETLPANSMMMESSIMIDESYDDSVGNEYFRSEESSEENVENPGAYSDYEDSQAIYEYYQMQFREICVENG